MSDLIKKSDAIKALYKYNFVSKDVIEREINAIPSADAVEVVRCEDCRHANECRKSVHYTRNEPNTVTIGYLPIEWCSRGEGREE